MEGGDKGKLWENAQLEMEGSDQEARMKKEVWERQEENQGGAVSCHRSQAGKKRGPRLNAKNSKGDKEAGKDDNQDTDLAIKEVTACDSLKPDCRGLKTNPSGARKRK